MKKFFFATIILMTMALSIQAQPNNPDVPVPLDGGLIALLAVGAVFGVKTLSVSKNNS